MNTIIVWMLTLSLQGHLPLLAAHETKEGCTRNLAEAIATAKKEGTTITGKCEQVRAVAEIAGSSNAGV